VSEGTRTPDRLDHNQELYQLSYAHRETAESTSAAAARAVASLMEFDRGRGRRSSHCISETVPNCEKVVLVVAGPSAVKFPPWKVTS
jgi:hypothetical protein